MANTEKSAWSFIVISSALPMHQMQSALCKHMRLWSLFVASYIIGSEVYNWCSPVIFNCDMIPRKSIQSILRWKWMSGDCRRLMQEMFPSSVNCVLKCCPSKDVDESLGCPKFPSPNCLIASFLRLVTQKFLNTEFGLTNTTDILSNFMGKWQILEQ